MVTVIASMQRPPMFQPGKPVPFAIAAALLLFVAVSGFAAFVLPFNTLSQTCVLLHVAVGAIGSAVVALWIAGHWLANRESSSRSGSIVAYFGLGLLTLSAASGLVELYQGAVARYVNSVIHDLHLWSSIFAVPVIAYHLWPKRTDDARVRHWRRRGWAIATAITVVLFTVCAGLALFYTRTQEAQRQWWRTGEADFTPSNVETIDRRPLAVELLANSASCGTADCHATIYNEWQPSAHRWSAEDEFFQEVRAVTTKVKGQQETEKCGACHDPVSMLSGHKDPQLGRAAPGYKEGDSCVVCHAVRKFDERGIGSYVLGEAKPYLYDNATTPLSTAVNHFLIRVYPRQHNRDFDLTLAKKPESCGPCHKEYDVLDPTEGPVQVETQYDDWKHGKWNTDRDPSKRLYCQQCHMHLVQTNRAEADPSDLKKNHAAQHHNHGFSAANQYMPEALSAPNAPAHTKRVHEWLRGERIVPAIEHIWPRGPIVELSISAPRSVAAGERIAVQIRLTNRKAGHAFPTGPLNIARAWIELVARDSAGRVLFHSGLLDADNHIEADTYILKPLAINASGQMVMKPDLWHPVGPKFRRAILAGESDTYDFEVKVPSGTRGVISIDARLRYSKANQFFMDAVYSPQHRVAPVTEIATGHIEVPLHK